MVCGRLPSKEHHWRRFLGTTAMTVAAGSSPVCPPPRFFRAGIQVCCWPPREEISLLAVWAVNPKCEYENQKSNRIYSGPRRTRKSGATNYHKLDKGGHFAELGQPQLFSAELRAAFAPLRSSLTAKN
jgi:hypothetical protein